jgi:hypothetical protein
MCSASRPYPAELVCITSLTATIHHLLLPCLQITLPQRDTQFATYTVALGFPVMGIFPPYADGTEVNAVDRSKDGKVRKGWVCGCPALGLLAVGIAHVV